MKVASVCPQCGMSYTVAQEHLGRMIRCGNCGGDFILGSASPGGRQQFPAPETAEFDPYHQWLGIPPEEQPPHHYRLLGLKPFEDNPAVIENAGDQRMAHLRTFQTGKRAALSQRLLNEVAAAKLCLLRPEKKAAYDEELQRWLVAATPPEVPASPAPEPESPGDVTPTYDYAGILPEATPPPELSYLPDTPDLPLMPDLTPTPAPPLPEELAGCVVLPELGQEGLVKSARKLHKRRNKPQSALEWTIGAMVAAVILAVLAWGVAQSGKTEAPKPQNRPVEETIGQPSESSPPKDSGSGPPSPAPTPLPDNCHLLVNLPQDERQGARLAIDDIARKIPSGGGWLEVSLPPGKHSLRIERPGYQAYVWKGTIQAGQQQAIRPRWVASAEPSEREKAIE